LIYMDGQGESSAGMSLCATILGQSSNVGPVIFWSLVLIVLVIGGAAGVMYLRRWLKEEDVPTSSGGIGFSISDLRQLLREGKMTEEEFERARTKMVAAGKAMAEKLPDPLGNRRQPHQQRPGSTPGTPPPSAPQKPPRAGN
jgi:hypothetical protein